MGMQMVESPPMENRAIPRFYLPELDGLRFFAFLLVFLNHTPFMRASSLSKTLHDYGWVGVDLFLCLSSFLLTKLLINEFEREKFINIKFFYARRILRIWPLYYAFILFSAIYSQANGISGFSWLRFLGLATFSDNLMAVILGEYNHLFAAVHLWTISYEEQFYFIIPFAAAYLINKSDKTKLAWLVSAAILGNIARALFIFFSVKHPAIYVFPPTHFESILAGMAIAFIPPLKKTSAFADWCFFITGMTGLILTTRLPGVETIGWNLMLTYPLLGISFGLIVLAVSNGKINIIKGFFSQNTFVYLGKISYGLYVFHLAALALTDLLYKTFTPSYSVTGYTITMMTAGLIITILFSVASYQIIEKPFLKLKTKFTLISSRPI